MLVAISVPKTLCGESRSAYKASIDCLNSDSVQILMDLRKCNTIPVLKYELLSVDEYI